MRAIFQGVKPEITPLDIPRPYGGVAAAYCCYGQGELNNGQGDSEPRTDRGRTSGQDY
jgi:hypothetical protein